MWLQSLQLINFKNYNEVKIDLSARVNVLVGKNGSGKTNLLDAIHYLSLTKSAFCTDQFAIRKGADFFTIKAQFQVGTAIHELFCSLQAGSKKIFRDGVNEYPKLSDHIGRFPVIMIAPDDTDLVKEGSDPRRKFFDSIISQFDRTYLDALIQYNYALKQRNSLLKMHAEGRSLDELVIQSYDEVLSRSGTLIFNKRKAFIEEFRPAFQKYYSYLVADEAVEIEYRSEVGRVDFETGLRQSRQRDLYLQRTNFGVHRDDYSFLLGDGDLKRLGSQGQQKSFIISLKLAQFDILKTRKGFRPILLLDDIFDKLDDFRIAKLLELIKNDELGQLFITDARPDRTRSLLESIKVYTTVVNVDKGNLSFS